MTEAMKPENAKTRSMLLELAALQQKEAERCGRGEGR